MKKPMIGSYWIHKKTSTEDFMNGHIVEIKEATE